MKIIMSYNYTILIKKYAFSAGDGIGPEVMHKAIMVFDAAQKIFGFELPYSEVDDRGQSD